MQITIYFTCFLDEQRQLCSYKEIVLHIFSELVSIDWRSCPVMQSLYSTAIGLILDL